MPTYRGNSQNFTWVIPTPSKPTISASSSRLFTQLNKLTQTSFGYYKSGPKNLSLSTAPGTDDIQVIEEKTIDIYQTALVKATSENALSDWMKENNYSFPEKSSYLLDSYVKDGWYFSLAKIRQDIKSAQFYSGQLTPLRLTFDSDRIIYPMKLTKIAGSNNLTPYDKLLMTTPSNLSYPQSYSRITTYVLTDFKVKNDELDLVWADYVTHKKINEIATETENDWLKINSNKLFLTAFYQDYYYSKMNNDIVFVRANNNQVYPTPGYMTLGYWKDFTKFFLIALLVFCLSPIVLLHIIIALLQKYEPHKNRYLKIIVKALLPLVSLGIAIYWLIQESQNSLHDGYTGVIKNEGDIAGAVSVLILGSLLLWLNTIIRVAMAKHQDGGQNQDKLINAV